jgi:hypothetical protein
VGQSSSALRPFIRNDALTTSYGGVSSDAAGTAFDGSWHHLALTYTGGTATIYVDGVSVGSKSSITPGTITLNRTAAGGLLRASASSFFAGTLDEVAFYNDALTATQILANYNRGATGT